MSEENKSWWKGSFPMWIVVGLLSLVWFGIQRTLGEIDAQKAETKKNVETIAVNSGRLAVLETEAKQFHDSILDLRKTSVETLVEVRQIAVRIKASP